jgi:hypothetical protein
MGSTKFFGHKSGVSADARQHAQPDFLTVMKCEHDIRPAMDIREWTRINANETPPGASPGTSPKEPRTK